MTVLWPKCRKCGAHEACIACDQNRESAARNSVENTALREQLREAHKVIAAVRVECAKFRFPEEDRPGLWDALMGYDDIGVTKMEEEE